MYWGDAITHHGGMIVAKGLTKRYRDTVAVDNLSFTVEPGVVTGFLGPNGSGKSTTMRMVMGLDNPSAGSAHINGQSMAEVRWPLREVGALLDAKAFHPGRTAYDHLLWLAETNAIAKGRIDEVLDIVGLTSVARRRAKKFSLGMGQRLGIASALLGDPGVLLFDEPVNGLDPEGIRWVRHLLRDLAAEGRTVFVSSHLISEMSLTADRLVVIGRGSLIADTSVKEFTAQNTHTAARVVTPMRDSFVGLLREAGATATVQDDGAILATGIALADIGELAARKAFTLHELSPVTGSLEDAFMELTHDSVEFEATKYRGTPEHAANSSGR
jgi:ABC-2 type transport system ATP-binding protein